MVAWVHSVVAWVACVWLYRVVVARRVAELLGPNVNKDKSWCSVSCSGPTQHQYLHENGILDCTALLRLPSMTRNGSYPLSTLQIAHWDGSVQCALCSTPVLFSTYVRPGYTIPYTTTRGCVVLWRSRIISWMSDGARRRTASKQYV